jgi:hypothetical protein
LKTILAGILLATVALTGCTVSDAVVYDDYDPPYYRDRYVYRDYYGGRRADDYYRRRWSDDDYYRRRSDDYYRRRDRDRYPRPDPAPPPARRLCQPPGQPIQYCPD